MTMGACAELEPEPEPEQEPQPEAPLAAARAMAPQLVEAKEKGQGFSSMWLGIVGGELRAYTSGPQPRRAADPGPAEADPGRLLLVCAEAEFKKIPAKYASMHVLSLQQPGGAQYYMRFEGAEDLMRWEEAIRSTQVWTPLTAPNLNLALKVDLATAGGVARATAVATRLHERARAFRDAGAHHGSRLRRGPRGDSLTIGTTPRLLQTLPQNTRHAHSTDAWLA